MGFNPHQGGQATAAPKLIADLVAGINAATPARPPTAEELERTRDHRRSEVALGRAGGGVFVP